MLNHITLENLICIDIETVPGYPEFASVPEILKDLYLRKSERLKANAETPDEQYFNHAGIYAEFGKIICITIGIFRKEKESGQYHFRIKSLCGDDEHRILSEFCELMNTHYHRPRKFQFCGHNIREFDIPFLCRRMLIQGIQLPLMLDISGKKQYELNMVDTMQLWRFGDFKHYTSLQLLAIILGIESPKQDMEGKNVGPVYWREKDLQRIVSYCQKDVETVAQLILKFKGLQQLSKENITIVD